MDEPQPRPDRLTLLAFVVIVVLLGANFVAVRFSNRELAPFWGAGLRFGVAALILFGVMWWRRMAWPRGQTAWGAMVYGLLNFGISYALLYWALLVVPAGLAAVIFSTLPLTTLLLASLVGLERLGWQNISGAVVAVGGITLIFHQTLQGNVQLGPLAAIFGAMAVGAVASVLIKRLPQPHPVTLNAIGMSVGTVLLLIVSAMAGERVILPTLPATWLALIWLIVSAIVAFILFVWIIVRWTASAATYALVLAPLVTVALAAWLVHERLTLSFIVGSVVVLIGAYIGTLKSRARTPVEPMTPAGPPSVDA
ncbi:MAG: EamA family transporter [Candidatus Kerfeldbacteria bacterium]|nr:EamA family transporter [Candidatus Kerfeldbacteria bacterium]